MNDNILEKINKVYRVNKLANILLIFSLLTMWHQHLYFICFFIGLILKIKSYNDLKVKLTYTIDKNQNKEYISMCEIFEIINKAKNIWQVNLNSNTRTQAEILIETPRCIKINIKYME